MYKLIIFIKLLEKVPLSEKCLSLIFNSALFSDTTGFGFTNWYLIKGGKTPGWLPFA